LAQAMSTAAVIVLESRVVRYCSAASRPDLAACGWIGVRGVLAV
jgi:hypothetical protein